MDNENKYVGVIFFALVGLFGIALTLLFAFFVFAIPTFSILTAGHFFCELFENTRVAVCRE